MIVVKIELHSAITGKVEEIGRTVIWNEGTGTAKRGNYGAKVIRRGVMNSHPKASDVVRTGAVDDYPRLSYNIWRLVIRALLSCFPEEKAK